MFSQLLRAQGLEARPGGGGGPGDHCRLPAETRGEADESPTAQPQASSANSQIKAIAAPQLPSKERVNRLRQGNIIDFTWFIYDAWCSGK